MCGRLESPTVSIRANVHGIAFGQKRAVLLVKESVVKTESGPAREGKGGFNADDIIITGWIVVATISLVYW
jgi:hypothetical protein